MCPCTCKNLCNAHQDVEFSMSRCSTHLFIFSGLIILWMLVLCEKPPLSPWHVKRCIEGECLECGVTIFKVCLGESIEWKNIGYEVFGKIDEGRDKKV